MLSSAKHRSLIGLKLILMLYRVLWKVGHSILLHNTPKSMDWAPDKQIISPNTIWTSELKRQRRDILAIPGVVDGMNPCVAFGLSLGLHLILFGSLLAIRYCEEVLHKIWKIIWIKHVFLIKIFKQKDRKNRFSNILWIWFISVTKWRYAEWWNNLENWSQTESLNSASLQKHWRRTEDAVIGETADAHRLRLKQLTIGNIKKYMYKYICIYCKWCYVMACASLIVSVLHCCINARGVYLIRLH